MKTKKYRRECHPNIGGYWDIYIDKDGNSSVHKNCFKCRFLHDYMYNQSTSCQDGSKTPPSTTSTISNTSTVSNSSLSSCSSLSNSGINLPSITKYVKQNLDPMMKSASLFPLYAHKLCTV